MNILAQTDNILILPSQIQDLFNQLNGFGSSAYRLDSLLLIITPILTCIIFLVLGIGLIFTIYKTTRPNVKIKSSTFKRNSTNKTSKELDKPARF